MNLSTRLSTFALPALCAALMFGATPSQADPAYHASEIVNLFAKSKAAKATRQVCFADDTTCGAAASATRLDLLVNFEFNSDLLTPPARENLAQFARALQDPQLKGQHFEIDGHTDAVGAEAYNNDLSDRRARAVVAFLANEGVDASTLAPKGFGKSRPRTADPFSPENRRVETHMID